MRRFEVTSPLCRVGRPALRWLPALALAAMLAGCVVAPYSYPYGSSVTQVSTFDRAWEAAIGAAGDAGIRVSTADRATGYIKGQKASAVVSISVQQLADGRVQVSMDAGQSPEANPTLNEAWLGYYNRRMGR